jgi:hypothetical protein
MRQHLQTFASGEEDTMLAHLERIDNATVKQLISSPRDIELKPDGKLASNDYYLTPLAFKQLCTYTAKGLYGLVADVGAVVGNARSLDAYTSPALATEIINKVVRLRFTVPDGISCKALILNTESKTVDGIVGARYRYQPHHQLYTTVRDMITDLYPTTTFARASLTGRRFAFTLINRCYSLGQLLLVPGLYFTNSEAGEAGIHAGPTLFVEDSFALGEMKHIAHTQSDFEPRLAKLVDWAVERYVALRQHCPGIYNKLYAPLNVVVANKISDVTRRRYTRQIAKYTGATLADEVMRKALFQGADGKNIPAKIEITEVATRTYRDLVLTLCRTGVGRYHTIRERLERAAFSFLLG